MFGWDIKVIVHVVTAGECIEAAAVLTEELAVLVLVREPLRPEEQHVLAEMRQTGQRLGVRHVTNVDIQRSGGFVGGRVGN